jgi:NAD(P)-dependent dehydrogenase (short-subunit alcohol dehydrogenase family)
MTSLAPCDLSKPAEYHGLVDLAVRAFGRIDVFFNRNRREEGDLVFYLERPAWPYLKARSW